MLIARRQDRKEMYSLKKHFQFKYIEFSKICLSGHYVVRETQKVEGDPKVSNQGHG